jgi:hypothetical protein
LDTHELKILPQYFQEVWDDNKNFELRKNDRDYKVGDYLVLREYSDAGYTGSFLKVVITYILKDCPEYGLNKDYCILGIRRNSGYVVE